jgi:putative ABC transport system ATP-binding protein
MSTIPRTARDPWLSTRQEAELGHGALSAARTPALEAVQLVRSFGDGAQRRVALNGTSFDLQAGRIALLMGPSGSGKSTLLAILSGLLRPDSGQVRVRSESGIVDLWSLSDNEREAYRRKHTGFIFQGYNLFPALTALQQLEIVLKWGGNLSSGEARDQSAAMLERLGLSRQMHKKPAQLSGGEKQRVAIGRALVKQPTFLFADEPTSALDWENGQHVIELLRDAAHSRGATIFVVSHDHRMVPFMDVSYHLEDGHLEEQDQAGHGTGPSEGAA